MEQNYSNLTLSLAKKHCNIDADYTEDDLLLGSYLDMACSVVETAINRPLEDLVDEDNALPPLVQSCILIYVAQLYSAREPVTFGSAQTIPFHLDFLLNLIKKY